MSIIFRSWLIRLRRKFRKRKWSKRIRFILPFLLAIALILAFQWIGNACDFNGPIFNLASTSASVVLGILSNTIFSRIENKTDLFPPKITQIEKRTKDMVLAYLRSLETGDDDVLIMDIFIDYLLDDNSLFMELVRVLNLKIRVDILLLNPQTKMAEQRENDLSEATWELMERQIRSIYNFKEQLDAEQKSYISIRLFDSATTFSYLQFDLDLIVSFFPSSKKSQKQPNLKSTGKGNEFSNYAREYFKDKWTAKSTCSIENYLFGIMYINDKRYTCHVGLDALTSNQLQCICLIEPDVSAYNFLSACTTNHKLVEIEFRNETVLVKIKKEHCSSGAICEPADLAQSLFDTMWELISKNYEWTGIKLLRDAISTKIFEVLPEQKNLTFLRKEQFELSTSKLSPKYYSIVPSEQFVLSPNMEFLKDYGQFIADYESLPLDKYLYNKQKDTIRKRRFGRFDFRPSTGELEKSTKQHFKQDEGVNRVHPGETRKFASLNSHAWNNRFLHAIIQSDFEALGKDVPSLADEWEVCVHQVRIEVNEVNMSGDPSPEGPHSDGYDYICMHFIAMKNCSSCESSIYKMEIKLDNKNKKTYVAKEVIDHTILGKTLASIIINDQMVAHNAAKIFLDPGTKIGYRDMLLIDFDIKK